MVLLSTKIINTSSHEWKVEENKDKYTGCIKNEKSRWTVKLSNLMTLYIKNKLKEFIKNIKLLLVDKWMVNIWLIVSSLYVSIVYNWLLISISLHKLSNKKLLSFIDVKFLHLFVLCFAYLTLNSKYMNETLFYK